MRRPWPGNMRELRAVAERFVLDIEQPDLAAVPPVSQETLAERVASFEAREIRSTLERCRGNTERAAQVLGMARRTLTDKIHRYGIRLE
jgi:two-component system C4-dicarboxylate transport response regulator DctD